MDPTTEERLALAIQATPEDPAPRLALARILVGRNQLAGARELLAGVSAAGDVGRLVERIRDLEGRPRLEPLAPRRPWLWSCLVVAATALGIGVLALVLLATPIGAPQLERAWITRREAERVKTGDARARLEAARMLYRLGEASAARLATLEPRDYADESEALAAVELLDNLGEWRRLGKALEHPSRRVRLHVARLVARRATNPVAADIEAWLFAARDEDVRVELASLLAAHGRGRGAQLLLDLADRPATRGVALRHIDAIARSLEGSEKVEALADEAMASGDRTVRLEGAKAALRLHRLRGGKVYLAHYRTMRPRQRPTAKQRAKDLAQLSLADLDELHVAETDAELKQVLVDAIELRARVERR